MRPDPGGVRRRSVFTARLQQSPSESDTRVLEEMRAAILRGDEPPGTAIPIAAVAAFFGVSQIPVREALNILVGEGLVDHVPRVGYSVAKLRFAELRELYEGRRVLEESALRAAIRLATEADDAAVRAAQCEIDDVADDHHEYHRATRNFHLAVIAPSGMRRLMRMYESAWNLTEPIRPMSGIGGRQRDVLADDHWAIAQAFFDRDIDRLIASSNIHYEHLAASIETLAGDPDRFRAEE